MKKFDKEYSTQYLKEVEYLKSKGIKYSFVKKVDEINVYKYKKSYYLFETLKDFYKLVKYGAIKKIA